MANKSVVSLRMEIDALEARVSSEKKHLSGVFDASRAILRNTLTSRKGAAGLFSAAVMVGIIGALRSASRRWR